MSVITFWFAIDDATLENGCLWVEQDALNSPLRERFNREGDSTTMEILDETPWPDENTGTPVEVKAGTLICFKGNLPHYSAPNRSDKSRQAFTLHVTDATTDYAESNWIQTEKVPLRGFE
jgi:phytanoyl-CoA hydroxylase